MRNEFYKDTQGALLVYDVSDRNSFESLDAWLLEMQNEIGNQTETDNVVVCVCANKVLTTLLPTNLFTSVNPFMPNGISHPYLLDQSFSVLRVAGWYFSILFEF